MQQFELSRRAASLDQGSEHPFAAAIVSAARECNLALVQPERFESGTGVGVRRVVGGRKIGLGNAGLMQAEDVATHS